MCGRRLHRVSVGVWLAAVVLLSRPGFLFAQTTSASVAGTVKDSQGGVLPTATVTLVSATQATEQRTATDGLGHFLFAYVRPDTYTLRVSFAGFQSAERTVVVSANDRLDVGTFTLAVGSLDETVVVAATPPDIQATSGVRGFTLEGSVVENLGVNGRSFHSLFALAPGVVTIDTNQNSLASFAVNGQRSQSNNLTIDGVANIDTGNNGGPMATTNMDAVAELKVLTSSYQAEYGRAVGMQVQVVTKSGSRDFSGAAYWYGRRSEWNANTWWNNRSRTAMAKSSRNDQGYTIGGPVFIPGRFNADRRKLFFFWSQEFQRRKDPVGETRATVPTALERQGDFSESVDLNGNPYPYIRDSTTGLPCSAANTSGCFRDGGVLGRIPAGRLYSASLAALSVFPLPNVTGKAGYNYASQTPSNQPRREEMVRVDFVPRDTWRVTGRYMQNTDNRELPYGVAVVVSNVDIAAARYDVPGRNWLISTTRVLGNATSLEVSAGSAQNRGDVYTTNSALTRTGAGMSELPMLFPGAVQDDLLPTMQFGGGRLGSPAVIALGAAPFTSANTTYDVVGSLTRTIGPHVLKAGLYLQRSVKDQSPAAAFNGAVSFGNDANNPFDSGHPFANAALGVYQTFTQAAGYALPSWHYTNVEWYAQDTWRARSDVTIDCGVRFYYLTPQWDVTRQAANFLPDQYSPSAAVRLYRPAIVNGVYRGYDSVTGTSVSPSLIGRVVPKSGNTLNGTLQAGQGIDDTLSSGGQFRVSPRLSVAWDIGGRQALVARGGFAMLYDRPAGNTVFNLITNSAVVQTQSLTWGRLQDLANAVPLNAPVTLKPTAYDWTLPKVYDWNAGVQVRLPFYFTWDVSYVGAHAENLVQSRPLNALPYGTTYLASSQDPTRGQPGGPAASALPGGNALPADLLRPYQGYAAINLLEFGAYSNYHSLQTMLSRRFSKGLQASVTYVYSRARGTVDDDYGFARIDGRDHEANYGILSMDRPHNFGVGFVYRLPPAASGALGLLVNDWQLSGNYRWMSGAPYAVTFSIPGVSSYNITGSDQGARIVLKGDPLSGWSANPYCQIDTSVFAPPQAGSIGMESPRYFVHGAPINNLDLSLSKSFPLGGRRRFEVRLDAFNALNHTQFAGVNASASFAGLTNPTITNLPYDASGKLTNMTGFGTVSGVRPARQLQLMTRFTF
jgi:hypothetical protein